MIILYGGEFKAFPLNEEKTSALLPLLLNRVLGVLARAIRQGKEIKDNQKQYNCPCLQMTGFYIENPKDSYKTYSKTKK
jgi:hypothetical protein